MIVKVKAKCEKCGEIREIETHAGKNIAQGDVVDYCENCDWSFKVLEVLGTVNPLQQKLDAMKTAIVG